MPPRKKTKRRSMREKTRQKANESGNFVANYVRLPQGFDLLNLEEVLKEHKKTQKVPIDILPFEITEPHAFDEDSPGEMKGDLWWRYRFYMHFDIGAEEKKYACLRTFGKKCPICLERKRLIDAGEDKKVTDPLRGKVRELFWVSTDGMKTAEIWDVSHFLFMKGLDKEVKTGPEEYADFPEMEGGYTIITRFSEESINGGSYYDADRYDFELRDDVPDELIDPLPDLASCIIELSYEKLEGIFYDTDTPDEEDEEGGEKEKASTRKQREEEEESGGDDDQGTGEEEGSEETDDEPAEKKTPAKRKPKKKAADPEPEEADETECPIEDGIYGVEWDEWDGCDECEFNKTCKAEGDRLRELRKNK